MPPEFVLKNCFQREISNNPKLSEEDKEKSSTCFDNHCLTNTIYVSQGSSSGYTIDVVKSLLNKV
jgi:hypothetical protein